MPHIVHSEQAVSVEMLNTVMVKVESILNARPFSPVTFDPKFNLFSSVLMSIDPRDCLLKEIFTFIMTMEASTNYC